MAGCERLGCLRNRVADLGWLKELVRRRRPGEAAELARMVEEYRRAKPQDIRGESDHGRSVSVVVAGSVIPVPRA